MISRKIIFPLLTALAYIALVTGHAWAESQSETAASPEAPNYNIDRFVVTGGGVMNVGTGSLRISLGAGQTVVGTVSSPSYIMSYGFWNPWGSSSEPSCCVKRVGDVNGLGGDEPTIGDVAWLIDALFITEDTGILSCIAEADINQSGGSEPIGSDLTVGDVAILLDYLFITGPSLGLPDCL